MTKSEEKKRPEDDVKPEDIRWRKYMMGLGKVEVEPGNEGRLTVEATKAGKMDMFFFDDGDTDFQVVKISVGGVDLPVSHLLNTPLSVFRSMTGGIPMGGRTIMSCQKIELVVFNVSKHWSKLAAALMISIRDD